MTTGIDQPHPILECLATLGEALEDVAGVDPVFMPTDAKAEALRTVTAVQARLEELKLRVLASADDVASRDGARDPAAWLAHQTRTDPAHARREQLLSRSLTSRPHLARALAAGTVTTAQAHVIARALADLPTSGEHAVDADVLTAAEAHLVQQAATFGPTQLRVLGRRILSVVAPELDEEHERRLLERDQARARKLTHLTTRKVGDGTTTLKAHLPDAVAGRLLTYLHAYTNPRHDNGVQTEAPDDRAPYDVRLGHAFCSLLEHLDPHRLPLHGGTATTVMVTIDLDALMSGLGTATTGTGEVITAGEARRLACTAGLIPIVLGRDSQPLDIGAADRFHRPHQRRAMAVRDGGCRAEGCDIPAAWCEAHHLTPWSRRKRTSVDDGALLCSHHHHRAHDPAYTMTRLPTGDYRFHRRT